MFRRGFVAVSVTVLVAVVTRVVPGAEGSKVTISLGALYCGGNHVHEDRGVALWRWLAERLMARAPTASAPTPAAASREPPGEPPRDDGSPPTDPPPAQLLGVVTKPGKGKASAPEPAPPPRVADTGNEAQPPNAPPPASENGVHLVKLGAPAGSGRTFEEHVGETIPLEAHAAATASSTATLAPVSATVTLGSEPTSVGATRWTTDDARASHSPPMGRRSRLVPTARSSASCEA